MWPVRSGNKRFAAAICVHSMEKVLADSSKALVLRNPEEDVTITLQSIDHQVVILKHPGRLFNPDKVGRVWSLREKPVMTASFDPDGCFQLKIGDAEKDEQPFQLYVPSDPKSGFMIMSGELGHRKAITYRHTGGITLQGSVHKSDEKRFSAVKGLIEKTEQDKEKKNLRNTYYERWSEEDEYLLYREISPAETHIVDESGPIIFDLHPFLVHGSCWLFRGK